MAGLVARHSGGEFGVERGGEFGDVALGGGLAGPLGERVLLDAVLGCLEAVGWAGRYAGNRVARFLAALPEPTPSGLFAEMVRQWTDEYAAVGFAGGCPLAAATVDCAESVVATREAASAAFATWSGSLAHALGELGVPEERVEAMATLMISALEGAILIARAERDVRALTAVARELGPLLDAAVREDDRRGSWGSSAERP